MAIRESLLNIINSIATSDYVRAVTSAGASSNVTVSDLAKTVVENYSGSTLAGSTQSVKSAADSLKSAVDSVESDIDSLQTNLDGMKIKRITISNFTIVSGTQSTPTEKVVDFADYGLPSGASIWLCQVMLNNLYLPYVAGSTTIATWVRAITSGTKVTIINTGSAWNNYTLYALIIYR